jgi:D-amino-acid dehydrogenase
MARIDLPATAADAACNDGLNLMEGIRVTEDRDDDAPRAGDPDVLILGAGVVGLACAHYLLRAGRSVHVVDRGRAGAATSHGNCGTITPSHAPPLAAPGMVGKGLKWMLDPAAPFYIRPRLDGELASWLFRFARRCNARDWLPTARARSALLECSRTLIEDDLVRGQGLDCGFEASGLRYVFRDPVALEKAQRDLPALRELGIAVSTLGGAELEGLEPCLRPGVAGGLQFSHDAHLRPERYAAELARSVRALGGTIEEGVAVNGFETAGDRVTAVLTDRGARYGREVLSALGPWSPAMLRLLGLRVPIQPGKGYSITTARPAVAPTVPIVLKERSVCVTAWADGFRLGSTMEFAGYDDSLNRRRLEAIERSAREYLHEPLGPGPREEWWGWRPMVWDDLPLLGRAPRLSNLWLAAGHGMLGVTMSAVTGHLLTDLICGRVPIVDPAAYAPSRFS